jgi:hypothetical protein
MPITEDPVIDERTALVRALFIQMKDAPEAQGQYRAAVEDRQAAEDRRTRMRAIARLPRHKRGEPRSRRPWQALGLTKAAWEAAGQPEAATIANIRNEPLPPTKHDIAEARKRHKRR